VCFFPRSDDDLSERQKKAMAEYRDMTPEEKARSLEEKQHRVNQIPPEGYSRLANKAFQDLLHFIGAEDWGAPSAEEHIEKYSMMIYFTDKHPERFKKELRERAWTLLSKKEQKKIVKRYWQHELDKLAEDENATFEDYRALRRRCLGKD